MPHVKMAGDRARRCREAEPHTQGVGRPALLGEPDCCWLFRKAGSGSSSKNLPPPSPLGPPTQGQALGSYCYPAWPGAQGKWLEMSPSHRVGGVWEEGSGQ